ncbi:1-pyrroline-5-carboxylate dehydrogenase [Salinibacterium hongtaonis]|nr:1-pyrroline-5-carboxylate dehydrogenase [Salinibacterium hongtaonis]
MCCTRKGDSVPAQPLHSGRPAPILGPRKYPRSMQPTASQPPTNAAELAEASVSTVRQWLAERPAADESGTERDARRLSSLMRDADVRAMTIDFVDRVMRPHDLRVAGRNFEILSRELPETLAPWARVLMQLGGGFSLLLPWPFVPLSRAVFRRITRHFMLDADPRHLEKRLAELKERGVRVTVTMLGDAITTSDDAERHLSEARELLARPDIDQLSLSIAAIAGRTNTWAHDESRARVIDRLEPLYEFAASSAATKFICLDTLDYADVELSLDAFMTLLDRPKLKNYEAGIVVQAYLPDALERYQRLTEWAIARRAEGGAGIKVRLVKGANLAQERAESEPAGWPQAPVDSRLDADTNFKRVLDWALTPERTDAVKLGIGSHNLFEIAYAQQLAEARGVAHRVDYEMLLGMTLNNVPLVASRTGGVLLSAPIVSVHDAASAAGYLCRRLDEIGDESNFASAADTMATDAALFDREASRFLRSVEALAEPAPPAARVQNRETPDGAVDIARTDPTVAANRAWARGILQRSTQSTLQATDVQGAVVRDVSALERIVADTAAAAPGWAGRSAADRAVTMEEIALVLDAYRARIIEVLVSEVGATVTEADAEASRASWLAREYARRVHELDDVENAAFVAVPVSLVAPSWTSPVADTVDGVLSALAAGSAVIVQPAHQAQRSASLVIAAIHEAGIDHALVAMVAPEDATIARATVAHPAIGRVSFWGDRDTAALLRSWRPERPAIGDSVGIASVIVTPSADYRLAAADIVASAFARGGQHPHGTRLVILVGSLLDSAEFRRELADAVITSFAGRPHEISTRVGPLIGPAPERLRRALSVLGSGESWLVQPEPLDAAGQLWRPGVRDGVPAESAVERAVAGPVIALTAVDTLEAAIDLQNSAHPPAAALYSLTLDEIALWLDSVDSGSVHVNHATIGPPPDTLPFGGWRGTTTGPDRVLALADWAPVFGEPQQSVRLDGVSPEVRSLIDAALPSMSFVEFDLVRAGAESDERAWRRHYRDPVELAEFRTLRTVVRHLPVATTIRLSEGASAAQLIRVLAAATRAGARIAISSAEPVAAGLMQLFGSAASPLRVTTVIVESDARWCARLQAGEVTTPHIRVIGGAAEATAIALVHRPEIGVYSAPITTSGRLELLPMLRTQTVTLTAHRYGYADPAIAKIEF